MIRRRCLSTGVGVLGLCLCFTAMALLQGCSDSGQRSGGESSTDSHPRLRRSSGNPSALQQSSFFLLRTPPEPLPLELRQLLSSHGTIQTVGLAQRVPNRIWPAWLLPGRKLLCLVAVFGSGVGETCVKTKHALVHGVFLSRMAANPVRRGRLHRLRGLGVAPDAAIKSVLKEQSSTFEIPVSPEGIFWWSDLATESPITATFVYRRGQRGKPSPSAQ